MCNVLPFVSNWTNDVFSRLFVQYVKLIKNKTKFMRCYLKTVDAHFHTSSNIIYPSLS